MKMGMSAHEDFLSNSNTCISDGVHDMMAYDSTACMHIKRRVNTASAR